MSATDAGTPDSKTERHDICMRTRCLYCNEAKGILWGLRPPLPLVLVCGHVQPHAADVVGAAAVAQHELRARHVPAVGVQ